MCNVVGLYLKGSGQLFQAGSQAQLRQGPQGDLCQRESKPQEGRLPGFHDFYVTVLT